MVHEGIELVRREGIDFLLAVGGGSVIDSSKAIAYGVPYEGDVWDFFAGKAKVEKALPVGVVLTLPASGSEMSDSCVITREENQDKPFGKWLCSFLMLALIISVAFHANYYVLSNLTTPLIKGNTELYYRLYYTFRFW